jgi:DNA-binding FadR family transcriptional regulator
MEMGGNDLLSSILGTYSIITFSFLAGYQEGLVRHPRETIREHRALIDAICKRDPIQAEHFARLHIIHSRERLAKEVKLPAYKAGHPAGLPVKKEKESPAQGKKLFPRKPLQPKS